MISEFLSGYWQIDGKQFKTWCASNLLPVKGYSYASQFVVFFWLWIFLSCNLLNFFFKWWSYLLLQLNLICILKNLFHWKWLLHQIFYCHHSKVTVLLSSSLLISYLFISTFLLVIYSHFVPTYSVSSRLEAGELCTSSSFRCHLGARDQLSSHRQFFFREIKII